MYVIIGATAAVLGVGLTLAGAAVVALQLRRVQRRLAALPSHPIFELEWRERQVATFHNLVANLAVLGGKLKSLASALARIGAAVRAMRHLM